MAGKKTFVAGEVLLAQDVNDYLMDQSVMTFASSAARASAIPTPTEGMTTYVQDRNQIETFDGAEYRGMSGLQLVKKQTIGTTVASVVVTSAFSATYENYKIIISGSTGATQNIAVLLTFNNSAGSTYNFGGFGITFATGASTAINAGASSDGIRVAATGTTGNTNASFDVLQPFLTTNTTTHGLFTNNGSSFYQSGLDTNSASQTGFTLSTSTTLTGGTIYVYGYGT
jgi:hypothetical protein